MNSTGYMYVSSNLPGTAWAFQMCEPRREWFPGCHGATSVMELRPAVAPEDLPAVSASVSQVHMHRTSASTSHSGDAHPWLTTEAYSPLWLPLRMWALFRLNIRSFFHNSASNHPTMPSIIRHQNREESKCRIKQGHLRWQCEMVCSSSY